MSQENVDLVRRWSDSWSRQDVGDLAVCFNDEIEFDFSNAQGPFSGIYRGRDDVIGFCASIWEAWDEVTIGSEAMFECGDECLVTATVLRAKGRGGIDVEAHVANLWAFRQGRISRVKLFQTRVRLSEPWACRSRTLTGCPERVCRCLRKLGTDHGSVMHSTDCWSGFPSSRP